MHYITPQDLARWYGTREIADTASPDAGPIISSEQLQEAMQTPSEDPVVIEAMNRVEDAIGQASRLMDSYLHRYTLPLDPGVVADTPLARVCGDLTRYLLHDDKPSEAIKERYAAAIRWLEGVASGKVILGGAESPPLAATGAGSPEFVAGSTEFGASALQGF
ncbi:MAG: DUF1320 domain-containing protein [Magnetococcus sp. YQC-5]